MEYFDYNLTDAFIIEPDPIQSNSKMDQVNRFHRQESAREANRRNEPASTRFLEAGLVLVFIAMLIIFFLLYLKFCRIGPPQYVKEKYTLKGGKWMPIPQGSLEGGDGEPSMSLFIPTSSLGRAAPLKSSGIKCSRPACVCAPGGGSKKKRQKGWRRNNYDEESYGPSNL